MLISRCYLQLNHNILQAISRTLVTSRKHNNFTRHVTCCVTRDSRQCHVTFVRRFGSEPPKANKQGSLLPVLLATIGGIGIILGSVLIFTEEKKKQMEEKKKEQSRRSRGKPLIGGPFELQNTEGVTLREKDFLGQWILIYFGFTFCPDICPEELEKIGDMLNLLDSTPGLPKIQPLFISVDPKRDTPELIKEYLKEFHPRFIGLTGTKEQIKRATKSYRVYFSESPGLPGAEGDYMVDHSIVTYLVNPKGEFSQHFGQKITAEEAVSNIIQKVEAFKEEEDS